MFQHNCNIIFRTLASFLDWFLYVNIYFEYRSLLYFRTEQERISCGYLLLNILIKIHRWLIGLASKVASLPTKIFRFES